MIPFCKWQQFSDIAIPPHWRRYCVPMGNMLNTKCSACSLRAMMFFLALRLKVSSGLYRICSCICEFRGELAACLTKTCCAVSRLHLDRVIVATTTAAVRCCFVSAWCLDLEATTPSFWECCCLATSWRRARFSATPRTIRCSLSYPNLRQWRINVTCPSECSIHVLLNAN